MSIIVCTVSYMVVFIPCQINEVVSSHLRRLLTEPAEEKGDWVCIVDQGDMKVFKRELEENGIPIDPMKAVCTVKVCTYCL